MFSKFVKAVKSKWIFSKPSKKLMLIYDLPDLFERFIEKNQYEVLDIRYQSINFYILIKTISKTGLKNLTTNYKKNYLIAVSPKLVITSIDNDLSFFKLKKLYKKAKFACIQISLRNTIFLEQCRSYNKIKGNIKLFSDFFYVYGKNDKLALSKYIDSKYILNGSVINNLYKTSLNNKIKKIIFIAQATFGPERLDQEIKIFEKIIKLSSELNLPLFYLLKTKNDHFITKKIKDYFKERILKKDFFLIERDKDTYSHLRSNALFFTNSSTLGFEAISRKKKVIFLPLNNFPGKNYFKKYPQNGPFWTNDHSYSNIKTMTNKILKINQRKWTTIVKKNISEIINFKPRNPELIKLLRKYNIKFKNNHLSQI